MRHVALTGGLATGKTLVRGAFERLGVPAFDSDAAARLALAPGTLGLRAVVARFGDRVRDPSGALDRRRLAEVVFNDAAARTDLEAIVHPEVRRARDAWCAGLLDNPTGFAIADIPLLYEVGLERDFDVVVVAACAPETQLVRAAARGGLSEADARRRIATQLPIGEKMRRADHVISTDGSFDETTRQVEELYERLRRLPSGAAT